MCYFLWYPCVEITWACRVAKPGEAGETSGGDGISGYRKQGFDSPHVHLLGLSNNVTECVTNKRERSEE